MKFLLPLTLCVLTLLSCSTSRRVSGLSGDWSVTTLAGKTVPAGDNAPFIGFDAHEGRIYGFTGCNRITGTLDAKSFVKGKADFSRLGMTRRYCNDDPYERPFVDALSRVTTSEVTASEILLKDSIGNTLITLQKK